MAAKLRPLKLIFEAVDRFSAPISRLNARFDALTAPVRRMNKELTRLSNNLGLARIRERAAGVGRAFTSMARRAALFGGILAGAATAGFARFLEKADQIVNLADRVGIGTEALQEYAFVAQQAGVEQGALNSSLGVFVKNLGLAKAGKGPLAALLKTGSQGRELLRQLTGAGSVEEALDRFADAVAAIEDPAKRAALAEAGLGRGGRAMINVLRLGSREIDRQREAARKLGIVISDQAVRSAEELGDKLSVVKLVMAGFANTIFTRLLPGVTRITDRFIAWANTGEGARRIGMIGDSIARSFERLIVVAPTAIARASDFLDRIGGIKTVVVGFLGLQLVPLAAGIASLAASFTTLGGALGIGALSIAPWLALIAGLGTLAVFGPEIIRAFKNPPAGIASLSGVPAGGPEFAAFGRPTNFSRFANVATGGSSTAKVSGQVDVNIRTEPGVRAEIASTRGSGFEIGASVYSGSMMTQ